MGIAIIPQPVKVERAEGVFRLRAGVAIGGQAGEVGVYVQKLLQEAAGFSVAIGDQGDVELVLSDDIALPEEAYRLSIQTDGVRLEASSQAGLFYGAQTLRQLLPVDAEGDIELPCLHIEDAPRFAWRGLHLDVCRHFFDVDFIKRYLDWMALYKYNVFHWHLTEDQGWRLAVDKYPKLAETSAWRTEKDGSRHGGFYTPEQVRDVVEYARRLHITVVPEIELPGHAQAVVAADVARRWRPAPVRGEYHPAKHRHHLSPRSAMPTRASPPRPPTLTLVLLLPPPQPWLPVPAAGRGGRVRRWLRHVLAAPRGPDQM